MPEGILKFSLPEERDEFEIACQASYTLGGIHEYRAWLRGRVRHGEKTEAEQAVLDECYKALFEFVPDHE